MLRNEKFFGHGQRDGVEEDEVRQRTNIEPETIGADVGKAQEDPAEEGQNEREGREVDDDVKRAIEGVKSEEGFRSGKEDDEHRRDIGNGSRKEQLYAKDEDVLCNIRSDETEVQQDVGNIADEHIKNFEGVKAVRYDADVKEQKQTYQLGKKDNRIPLQQPLFRFRREDRAKRQVAQINGRQKGEEEQEGR